MNSMDNKYQDVIQKVVSGEMVYSYSSIREFLKSPLHFLQYKTGEKKTTDAMRRGVLIHKLLLEPDEFSNEYVVFEKPIPSATMAKKENKEAYQALEEANPDKRWEDQNSAERSVWWVKAMNAAIERAAGR